MNQECKLLKKLINSKLFIFSAVCLGVLLSLFFILISAP